MSLSAQPMSISELMQAMSAAGAPLEAILIAVRAIEARDGVEAERKAKRAEQKRNERARDDAERRATVARQSGDSAATVADNPPLEVSPEVSPKDNISNPLPSPLPNPPKTARNAQILRERREFAEKLWRIIPKRRGDSYKPFETAVLKALADGAEPKEIIDGAVVYAAAEQGRDAQYRRGAAVWINKQGWTADWSPQDEAGGELHPFAVERQNEDRMKEYARRKGLM